MKVNIRARLYMWFLKKNVRQMMVQVNPLDGINIRHNALRTRICAW